MYRTGCTTAGTVIQLNNYVQNRLYYSRYSHTTEQSCTKQVVLQQIQSYSWTIMYRTGCTTAGTVIQLNNHVQNRLYYSRYSHTAEQSCTEQVVLQQVQSYSWTIMYRTGCTTAGIVIQLNNHVQNRLYYSRYSHTTEQSCTEQVVLQQVQSYSWTIMYRTGCTTAGTVIQLNNHVQNRLYYSRYSHTTEQSCTEQVVVQQVQSYNWTIMYRTGCSTAGAVIQLNNHVQNRLYYSRCSHTAEQSCTEQVALQHVQSYSWTIMYRTGCSTAGAVIQLNNHVQNRLYYSRCSHTAEQSCTEQVALQHVQSYSWTIMYRTGCTTAGTVIQLNNHVQNRLYYSRYSHTAEQSCTEQVVLQQVQSYNWTIMYRTGCTTAGTVIQLNNHVQNRLYYSRYSHTAEQLCTEQVVLQQV